MGWALFHSTSSGLGSMAQIRSFRRQENKLRTPTTMMTHTGRSSQTILPACFGTSLPLVLRVCPCSTHLASRDHDELRHSLRSVLANFRPYTRRFHILASDIDYPVEDPNDSMRSFPDPGSGYWRLGLQPQWLGTADNMTPEWRDGDIQLSLTHHAHFFEPYNRTIFNRLASVAPAHVSL